MNDEHQNELSLFRKVKRFENFHVFLWLLKDVSWCNTWVKFGVFMAVPTLLLQIYITFLTRKNFTEMVHNVAVCLWLCANITWMSGEFFYNGGNDWFDNNMIWLPDIFFFTGIGMVAIIYAYHGVKWAVKSK